MTAAVFFGDAVHLCVVAPVLRPIRKFGSELDPVASCLLGAFKVRAAAMLVGYYNRLPIARTPV